jgi:hypothetical protein
MARRLPARIDRSSHMRVGGRASYCRVALNFSSWRVNAIDSDRRSTSRFLGIRGARQLHAHARARSRGRQTNAVRNGKQPHTPHGSKP